MSFSSIYDHLYIFFFCYLNCIFLLDENIYYLLVEWQTKIPAWSLTNVGEPGKRQVFCLIFFRSVTTTIVLFYVRLFVLIVLFGKVIVNQSISSLAFFFLYNSFLRTKKHTCPRVICFLLNWVSLLFRHSSHLINLHKFFSSPKEYVRRKCC